MISYDTPRRRNATNESLRDREMAFIVVSSVIQMVCLATNYMDESNGLVITYIDIVW